MSLCAGHKREELILSEYGQGSKAWCCHFKSPDRGDDTLMGLCRLKQCDTGLQLKLPRPDERYELAKIQDACILACPST